MLSLVTLPILVRELGADGFGIWALLQAFSATNGWLSITLTGLAVAAVREVAGAAARPDDDRLGSAVAASFTVLALPGVVLGALMAAVGAPLLDRAFDLDIDADTLRVATIALGVTVALDHVFGAIGAVLEGLQRVAAARGLDAVRKTSVAAAAVVAAVVDGDIDTVAVAAAGATLASVLVAAVVAGADRRVRPTRPAAGQVRGVVRYAATLSTLTATGVLHRTMDRIIAGAVYGPTAVAVVEVANQVQGGATALLSATSYPVLSAAPWLHARDDPAATRSLLERVTRYSTVLTLPLVVVIVVAAGPLVRAWVGDGIGEEASGLVQVAVLYVAVAAPLQAGSNLLQGIGRAGAVLRASRRPAMAREMVSPTNTQTGTATKTVDHSCWSCRREPRSGSR